eukprot:gene18879-25437_t
MRETTSLTHKIYGGAQEQTLQDFWSGKTSIQPELQRETSSPLTADALSDKEKLELRSLELPALSYGAANLPTLGEDRDKEVHSVKEMLLVSGARHIELTNVAADHEAHVEKLEAYNDRQSSHHFVENCFTKVVSTAQIQKLEAENAQAEADVKQLQAENQLQAVLIKEQQLCSYQQAMTIRHLMKDLYDGGKMKGHQASESMEAKILQEEDTVTAVQEEAVTGSEVKGDEEGTVTAVQEEAVTGSEVKGDEEGTVTAVQEEAVTVSEVKGDEEGTVTAVQEEAVTGSEVKGDEDFGLERQVMMIQELHARIQQLMDAGVKDGIAINVADYACA